MDAARSECRADHDDVGRPEFRAGIRRHLLRGLRQRSSSAAIRQRSAPAQPFFEAALGGAGSAFCEGFSSCTAAVVKNANHEQLHPPNAGVPVVVGSEPAFFLEAGPHHSQQPRSRQSPRARRRASTPTTAPATPITTRFTRPSRPGIGMASRPPRTSLGPRARAPATSLKRRRPTRVLNPYNVRQSMYGPQFFDYKFIYTQTFLWS